MTLTLNDESDPHHRPVQQHEQHQEPRPIGRVSMTRERAAGYLIGSLGWEERTVQLLLRPEAWRRRHYQYAGPIVAKGGSVLIDLLET